LNLLTLRNKVYQEPAIPRIPEKFILGSIAEIEERYELVTTNHHGTSGWDSFLAWKIDDPEFIKWAQPYFDFDLTEHKRTFTYQAMMPEVTKHKDVHRKYVYNYILDAGGDEVDTVFFDDVTEDANELFRFRIPTHKWNRLHVKTPHEVVGQTKRRLGITVCKVTKQP